MSSVSPLPDWLRSGEEPITARFQQLFNASSPESLERLATQSAAMTRRHFGRTMALYAPLYLANFCSNGCVYCGFASDRKIVRRKLDPGEIREQLEQLAAAGFEEVLLLTGEQSNQVDPEYVRQAVSMAAEKFHSVSVETFPMSVEEYRMLVDAGATGVTLYQETYDPAVYAQVHRWGPKKDYLWRLDAPGRALEGGMRWVGLGVLMGLADPAEDLVSLVRHVRHIQRNYWSAGLALSLPRLCAQEGGFSPLHEVTPRVLAAGYMALRCVFPEIPLVLSTRESARFRDGMSQVCITRMSVASRTEVGGYGAPAEQAVGQFEVSDTRTVADFCDALRASDIEPMFKNWDAAYRGFADSPGKSTP